MKLQPSYSADDKVGFSITVSLSFNECVEFFFYISNYTYSCNDSYLMENWDERSYGLGKNKSQVSMRKRQWVIMKRYTCAQRRDHNRNIYMGGKNANEVRAGIGAGYRVK